MSNFNIHFLDSLYDAAKNLAEKKGISLNQFILMAVAKEVGWQEDVAFYQNMMNKAASPVEFHRLLDKAPDTEPENPDDCLDG
jgi:hypothetical protein